MAIQLRPAEPQEIGKLARIIAEATSRKQDVTLEVVKENRVLRIDRRLGFEIVGEDAVKYHMRRSLRRRAGG